MAGKIEKEISNIVSELMNDYRKQRNTDKVDMGNQPQKKYVGALLDKIIKLIFAGYFRDQGYKVYNLEHDYAVQIEDAIFHMNKQVNRALRYNPEVQGKTEQEIEEMAEDIVITFFKKLPLIREYVEGDLEAAYDGDPAAYYHAEIVLAYPGLYAITVNRIAHELFQLGVPLLPRIMTEHAHWQTGIDIHPGATIGRNFFIDHGTGIVVGETTVIGNNVKIYQGVTLGALSTRGGQKLQDKRRHPTIEDDVVIYSGASILGGDTVIGKGSVIGSNAFVTKSIAPETRVSIRNQELIYANQDKNIVQKTELEQDDNWR